MTAVVTDADQLGTSDFIASIPAFLGYIPDDRMILMFNRNGKIGMVYEAEFDQPHTSFAERIAAIAARERMRSVRIVLVCDFRRAYRGAMSFADTVGEHLDRAGIAVAARAHTTELRRGGSWTDLDHQTSGAIPDPAETWAAVCAVADGHIILSGRDDSRARFAQLPEPDDATRARAALESAHPSFYRTTLRELCRHITADTIPRPDVAARVALLTANDSARHALIGVALLDLPAAAQLYTALAAHLRGIERAHLLAAAALIYYITGQGIVSYDAITQATAAARADRTKRFPSLIHFVSTAHERAITIEDATILLANGQLHAAKFGIDVPDPTDH
ncbi:DUF4192 family protein [Nocardia terpenica]|uniref:DUF4192 family protein n=1 Tax=Nocardia terpenica TaxID=455432 RepID=A0A6G9ZF96_9NOCA|nr:DUF4192 family protein [Nocardia terpenica]QIS23663.1 DUF4192 family protein [Nocardia terpenica]